MMCLRTFEVLAFVTFHVIQWVSCEHILSCDIDIIGSCPDQQQYCSNSSKQCMCLSDYTMVNGKCEKPASNDSRHNGTVAVATIFTLALLTCGLVLVIKRYNLIEYIRQKINLRRNNDIMYEDVMIGQDDPPLSP